MCRDTGEEASDLGRHPLPYPFDVAVVVRGDLPNSWSLDGPSQFACSMMKSNSRWSRGLMLTSRHPPSSRGAYLFVWRSQGNRGKGARSRCRSWCRCRQQTEGQDDCCQDSC